MNPAQQERFDRAEVIAKRMEGGADMFINDKVLNRTGERMLLQGKIADRVAQRAREGILLKMNLLGHDESRVSKAMLGSWKTNARREVRS